MKNKLFLIIALLATLPLISGCNNKSSSDTNNMNSGLVDNIAIQGELQDQIDKLESQKNDLSFPFWLSELNIIEPVGMEIDPISSYQTTHELDGFDSIHFVYAGDYDYAMTQAEHIAKIADIQVSAEFKMAQDMIEKMELENPEMQEIMGDLASDLKGIVYTNYSLIGGEDVKYLIAVTVNEDGSLELDVTDIEAMQDISDQYIK